MTMARTQACVRPLVVTEFGCVVALRFASLCVSVCVECVC